MKPIFFPTLFSLAVLTHLSLAQDNSELFSQYIGAPTASAMYDGSSASDQSLSFTICTNYIHGLPPLQNIATSALPQLEQMQVDGVCQFCTSLSQSRVDSCCAVASSVACFEKFAAVGAAQKTPPSTAASTTPAANTATATGGASTPTATTSNSISNKVDVVDIARPILAMLSCVGWALL